MSDSRVLLADQHGKLVRARRLLEELRSEEEAYVAATEVRHEVEVVEESGLVLHLLKADNPVPANASHVASEIAYHLRSCLDQAVCAIARANGVNDTRPLAFPFVDKPEDFHRASTAQKIAGLPDTTKAAIAAMRPWTGGDPLLVGIGRLANVDKHNLLMPISAVGGLSAMRGYNYSSGSMNNLPFHFGYGHLLRGFPFAWHGPGGHLYLSPGGSLGIRTVFGFGEEVPLFAMYETVAQLDVAISFTETILDKLEESAS